MTKKTASFRSINPVDAIVVLLVAATILMMAWAWVMAINFERQTSVEPEIVELEPVVVQDSALYWAGKYGIDAGLAREIMDLAEEYGFDKELVFSVIQTESNFRENAVSPVGAIGIMQVMLPTARHYRPGITRAELFDTDTNIRIGLSYLRDMLQEFGTLEAALIAYNAGPSRARRILDKHGTDVYYVRAVLGG